MVGHQGASENDVAINLGKLHSTNDYMLLGTLVGRSTNHSTSFGNRTCSNSGEALGQLGRRLSLITEAWPAAILQQAFGHVRLVSFQDASMVGV